MINKVLDYIQTADQKLNRNIPFVRLLWWIWENQPAVDEEFLDHDKAADIHRFEMVWICLNCLRNTLVVGGRGLPLRMNSLSNIWIIMMRFELTSPHIGWGSRYRCYSLSSYKKWRRLNFSCAAEVSSPPVTAARAWPTQQLKTA